MKATDISLFDFLSEKGTYIVPVYQREFVWEYSYIERLIKNILEANDLKEDETYFLGSIVLQRLCENENRFYVVDGQQRLTSLMLFLKVCLGKIDTITSLEDESNYKNSLENLIYLDEKHFKPKLIRNGVHSDDFKAILTINDVKHFKDEVNKFAMEYKNIWTNFNKILNEVKDKDIISALKRVKVVKISLEKEEDAQNIFESLNFMTKKLNNSDLIRNYLLMVPDREMQEYLYNNYWNQIVKNIGNENLEMFFSHFITYKTGSPVNFEDIYDSYKKYAEQKIRAQADITREDLLNEILNISDIYKKFLDSETFKKSTEYKNVEVQLLEEIREIGQTTVYPFLIAIYQDLEDKKEILIKVLNLLVIYLVRRTFCRVSSSSLRDFMAKLYRSVFNNESNKKYYYESIYRYLNEELDSNNDDRMVSEEDFEKSILEYNLYKNRVFAKYILYRFDIKRLNNINLAGVISYNPDMTIEHIMPQTFDDEGEWVKELTDYDNPDEAKAKEIQSKYLHKLNNLTLYTKQNNTKIKNKSFKEKIEFLRENNSINGILNYDLYYVKKFNKDALDNRGERLKDMLLDLYKLDQCDTMNLPISFGSEIRIKADEGAIPIFDKSIIKSFKIFDSIVRVNTYDEFVVEFCKKIYDKDKNRFIQYVEKKENSSDLNEGLTIKKITSPENKKNLICDDYYVTFTGKSRQKVQKCYRLLKDIGYGDTELEISIKYKDFKSSEKYSEEGKERLIREALSKLAEENKIIYDFKNFPYQKGNWIKYQSSFINDKFPISEKVKWDGNFFYYGSFFEISIKGNFICLTITGNKYKDNNYVEIIKKENITECHNHNNYWHIDKQNFDWDKLIDKNDENKTIDNLKDMILKSTQIIEKYLYNLFDEEQVEKE